MLAARKKKSTLRSLECKGLILNKRLTYERDATGYHGWNSQHLLWFGDGCRCNRYRDKYRRRQFVFTLRHVSIAGGDANADSSHSSPKRNKLFTIWNNILHKRTIDVRSTNYVFAVQSQ